MLLILLLFVHSFIVNCHSNCYFIVKYSNGSSYRCLDEECSMNHIDIISLEDNQCRTNYLALKYSSYKKYSEFLLSHSSISSSFSKARLNLERLLQIEFVSPLETDDSPFQLNQFRMLTNSTSNIDTYELVFDGNIAKENSILFIDKDSFMSNEQEFIDTLRLIFNCTNNDRVEWELVKSISSLPPSPCPEQIRFKENNNSQFCLNMFSILISLIILLILIFFFFFDSRSPTKSISQTELIEKF